MHETPSHSLISPTHCAYAPAGEYIKDHSFVFHEGWWHLFSISGIEGFCHAYTGNEETISWSISQDLVNWQMRGHVLHASQRSGTFDQHEIWAPYCMKGPDGTFRLFYTGIVHPHRPMEYARLGHDHRFVWEGHRETQGLAMSRDLTEWIKVADPVKGLGVAGRDSHVVRDAAGDRWLLYSTGPCRDGHCEAFAAQSQDLEHWTPLGICARFPSLADKGGTTESLTVMLHPLTGQWIMLGNYQYALSDDPTRFTPDAVRPYDLDYQGKPIDIGFAGEMLCHEGRWYRSGVIGRRDYWKLGFTEVEWNRDGAFRVAQPSVMSLKIG